ncbi:hypothetical protein GCM10029992_66090 [Glycomyces albus]
MRLPARFAALAAAGAVAIGLAACTAEDEPASDDSETTESAADEEAASTENPQAEEQDDDTLLESLVGTWEADVEDVGYHGSKLTVAEDGSATLYSFASQRGPHEGEILFAADGSAVFQGVIVEDGAELDDSDITIDLEYDGEADTLVLTYPGGEDYEHARVG